MNDMSNTEILRNAYNTAKTNEMNALKAHRERFPHLCTECKGEGARPTEEAGFEVCAFCVVKGLDPLDTRLSLVCDAEGLSPQEAVEEGELDALTMPSCGVGLTDWGAHPQRALDALQEEVGEIVAVLKGEVEEEALALEGELDALNAEVERAFPHLCSECGGCGLHHEYDEDGEWLVLCPSCAGVGKHPHTGEPLSLTPAEEEAITELSSRGFTHPLLDERAIVTRKLRALAWWR